MEVVWCLICNSPLRIYQFEEQIHHRNVQSSHQCDEAESADLKPLSTPGLQGHVWEQLSTKTLTETPTKETLTELQPWVTSDHVVAIQNKTSRPNARMSTSHGIMLTNQLLL